MIADLLHSIAKQVKFKKLLANLSATTSEDAAEDEAETHDRYELHMEGPGTQYNRIHMRACLLWCFFMKFGISISEGP